MARVAYSGVPDVAPATSAGDDYQHIDANPAAFGAPIAQGLEKLGAGAMDAQKFYTQVAADNSTNNTLDQITKTLYGDPGKTTIGPDGQPVADTGYFGLRGADAMHARPDVSKQIDEIIRENREGLSTPAAQYQYDVDTRRYRAQWMHEVGAHAEGQQKIWATDTNSTAAQIALNTLARNPNDPAAVGQAAESVRKAFVRNAQLAGEDPQGAMLKADQAVAKMQIEALLPTDQSGAERVLNANRGILASLPDYDSLSERVRNRVTDAELGPASQSFLANHSPGGSAAPNNIGNVKTADASRSGALQFQQPKTPEDGVALTVSTLRRGYQGMTLDQIGQKWEGTTPAHVATWIHNVSAASGIAPGTVPDLNDPKQLQALVHGIGVAEKSPKDRAAFTPDVITRGIQKGMTAGKQATPQGTADYYRSNYTSIVQDADAEAERLHPGDAVFADKFRSRIERNMNDYIRQQELSYKANADTVFQAFDGKFTGGHMPTSVDEMRHINPQISDAWDRYQEDNPQGALAVETRLFNANSRGRAAGYGTEFYRMMRQVLAPSDDPSYVRDPSQFLAYVEPGDHGPLSNTGFSELQNLLKIRGTPQGESFAAAYRTFLDAAHGQISGSDPRTGTIDHKGEEQFQKFLPDALAKMDAGLKAGKTPAQMFNPQSKDYIGDSIYNYTRTVSQRVKDMTEDKMSAAMYGPKPLSLQQVAAVDRAVKAKSLSPAKGEELKALMQSVRNGTMTREKAIAQAVHDGLIAPPAPQVPLPSGQ